jgi:hypothetical protein
MGCDEQNGVPDSMGKMQRHPLAQGLLTPQLPPQVARPFPLLRNCRADTVPAHKTLMISAAKRVDLIFFFMIFLLSIKAELFGRPALACAATSSETRLPLGASYKMP